MHHLDRQGEDDRRIFLGSDFRQRLKVSQCNRDRLGGDYDSGLGQLLRGFQFARCVDDFSTLLALGFGLPRHRALHIGRQIDVLDLDRRHLDAPRIGMLIQDLLQLLVESIAF